MRRRTFLTGTGVCLIQPSLSGCSFLIRKPDPTCLFEQHVPNNSGLLIDAHAHFFNGSDLQVKKFIEQVVGREVIDWVWLRKLAGGILQHVAWGIAPTVKNEMAELAKANVCPERERINIISELRQQQFNKARAEFLEQVDKLRANKNSQFMSSDYDSLENVLPPSYEALFTLEVDTNAKNINMTAGLNEIVAAFRFFVEMLQYRYVSAHNYLSTYNQTDRKIDLVIAHLVDYDWFLNSGKLTPSEIPDQIVLMGELVKLSNGIVNFFAPYCPLRHVAWQEGFKDNNFDPLFEVKKAVELYGAMGVKLYPPMGFSLWGNQILQEEKPWLWKERDFLPDICKTNDFGQRLDSCLEELYTYCQNNNVPIMAHTAASNLTDNCFKYVFDEKLLHSLVTKEFPNLKISFGHFGGFGWNTSFSKNKDGGRECSADSQPFWKEIVNLIEGVDESKDLFIDTGFFSRALEDKKGFALLLTKLLDDHPLLIEKMLYGTDWKMIVTEPKANSYLDVFEDILNEPIMKSRINESRKNAVMGLNAAKYLGLAKDEVNNRSRAEQFFQGRRSPHWFEKT